VIKLQKTAFNIDMGKYLDFPFYNINPNKMCYNFICSENYSTYRKRIGLQWI